MKMLNTDTLYQYIKSPSKLMTAVVSYLRFGKQNAIRKAINQKWSGAVPAGVYWINEDPNDSKRLNMGEHGSHEWAVKRAYHSLLSGYGADRMHFDRTYKYLPCLLLFIPLIEWTFTWAIESPLDVYGMVSTLWTGLALFIMVMPLLASSFVWRWLLPSKVATAEEERATLDIIERCLVRLPSRQNVPEDVRDTYRIGDIDKDGDSVVGQIVASDMETCAMDVQARENRIVFFLAGLIMLLAVNIPDGFAIYGVANKTFVLTLCVILLAIYEIRQPAPHIIRAQVMDKAAKQSATEYLRDSAGRAFWQNVEQAKSEQQQTASKDGSPLFKFGDSTGVLASRRDPFAPCMAGMPVCLSLSDLTMHLFALGASGTGKTSSVIRPVVAQWLQHKAGGMLVLDGKGQLADELKGADGYTVLSPESSDYNAIEGLLPEQVADTFYTLFSAKSEGGDTVFDNSARTAILNAGVLLHEAGDSYTIKAIYDLLSDEEERSALVQRGIDQGSPMFITASDYWLNEYETYSERIKSSILVTCKSWLAPVIQNRHLSRWNDCERGEKIEGVLSGELLGLSLPEAKYGEAGNVITMLAMRRLYQAAKLRGDTWGQKEGQMQVLLVADEVQNIISKNDIEFIPIARSLGVTGFFATQNIDGLQQKIGREETQQLLGNFANVVAFAPRTKDSDEWLSNRTGKIWRTVVERFNGFPDSRFSIDSIVHSGAAKKIHATPDEVFINRNVRLGRTGHIAGSEDQAHLANQVHTFIKRILFIPMADEPDMKEPYADVQVTPSTIVDNDEIDSLLAKRGTAIAVFRRAGVVRRDVIQTQYMSSFGGANNG